MVLQVHTSTPLGEYFNALFEQRSWKYILIDGGFITVYFTLIGFILGLWR